MASLWSEDCGFEEACRGQQRQAAARWGTAVAVGLAVLVVAQPPTLAAREKRNPHPSSRGLSVSGRNLGSVNAKVTTGKSDRMRTSIARPRGLGRRLRSLVSWWLVPGVMIGAYVGHVIKERHETDSRNRIKTLVEAVVKEKGATLGLELKRHNSETWDVSVGGQPAGYLYLTRHRPPLPLGRWFGQPERHRAVIRYSMIPEGDPGAGRSPEAVNALNQALNIGGFHRKWGGDFDFRPGDFHDLQNRAWSVAISPADD